MPFLFGNKKVKVDTTDINIDQAMKALQDNKEAVDKGAILWLGADEDGNVTHIQAGNIKQPVPQNGYSVLLNALSDMPQHDQEELPVIEPTEDDEKDLQQFYKQQRQEISPSTQRFLNSVGCFFLLITLLAVATIIIYPHLPASVQVAPGLYFNIK